MCWLVKACSTICRVCLDMISKPVRAGPKPLFTNLSNCKASSMDAIATIAVHCAAGNGNNWIVALVMIPRVPSLPINKSLRA